MIPAGNRQNTKGVPEESSRKGLFTKDWAGLGEPMQNDEALRGSARARSHGHL